MAKRNQQQRASCPFELSMDLLSGKWKGMIIFLLKDQPRRFTDIKNTLNSISGRMLTLALGELVADGLISRQAKIDSSSEIEYVISDLGKKLIPILLALREWGVQYQGYLKKSLAPQLKCQDEQ